MRPEFDELVISSDQVFYDQESIGSVEEHTKWMHEIEFYFNGYANKLNRSLEGKSGLVAELGAGSCGLSSCLSRLSNVSHITSVDISMLRMQKMIDLSEHILGGDKTKIHPIASDFNKPLPFENCELDAVVFDAALHHTRSMWDTLGECYRVLKPGGVLVAQRELFLNQLRAKSQIANLLKSPEAAAKVSENMYLKEQYIYYLKMAGFNVEFQPRSPSKLKNFLQILNGVIFCDGIFWCWK